MEVVSCHQDVCAVAISSLPVIGQRAVVSSVKLEDGARATESCVNWKQSRGQSRQSCWQLVWRAKVENEVLASCTAWPRIQPHRMLLSYVLELIDKLEWCI